MDNFEYKTNGNSSPYDKQQVFFACHPDDFAVCFDKISQMILKIFDCAIWYCRDENIDKKDLFFRLDSMQLIVIPVTKKFLAKKNRARDIDLPYALEKHIPVFPLIEECGATEKFAEIFGNLHYLDKNSCDITTLTYEEKVQKFLSLILLDSEEIKKVQDAFYARIFLSYRKKDRAYANEIMKIIHDIPFCRDIAIWYDEYLVPGEDFNYAILDKIKKSDLFTLCVTENILNDNNYIQKIEYPKAREFSVPIFPIIAEEIQREKLKKIKDLYEAIPNSVLLDDTIELERNLRLYFFELAMREKKNDPAHLFLIGLAYLNGIEVEVNYNRGLELLEKSAESDFMPAIEKLTHMYQYGEGVNRNLEKALELFDNQMVVLSKNKEKEKLFYTYCDALNMFYDAGEIFSLCHIDHIKKYTTAIRDILPEIEISKLDLFKIFSLLAFVNVQEEICDFFISKAVDLIEDEKDFDEGFLPAIGSFYSQMAKFYYKRSAGTIVHNVFSAFSKEREQSVKNIFNAVEILEGLYKNNSVKWSRGYADVLMVFCEMNFVQQFCGDKYLISCAEKALKLLKELYQEGKGGSVERLASLSLKFANYLALDIDLVWEKELDIILDLELEKTIGRTPEQMIPLDLKILDDDENEYDIRRIRKTLALMRYSVSLYNAIVKQEELHCLIELADAYFCLGRMLSCLSCWISDLELSEIKNIHSKLMIDCYLSYKSMLEVMSLVLKKQKNHSSVNVEKVDVNRYRCITEDFDDGKKTTIEETNVDTSTLLEQEEATYSKNPFSECYNFAVKLSEYGLLEESIQLHTDLYVYFKKVNYKEDIVLVLMNLYEYALCKTDTNEMLSIFIDFEESYLQEYDLKHSWVTDGYVFLYYSKIAQCYMQNGDYVNADKYFDKADKYSEYMECLDIASFVCEWAKCKTYLGKLDKGEELSLIGIERLMKMSNPPVEKWNELCKTYSDILMRMGKIRDANDWSSEIIGE